MRNLMLSTFVAFAFGALSLAFASSERPPELNCHAGPIEKSYGGSSWLVYACDDNRSAVVASGQGNQAMPFFFILYVRPDGEIQLYGEGTGGHGP